MKAVLSQTGFCGGAHLHGNKKNRLHADLDSNGWPQQARNLGISVGTVRIHRRNIYAKLRISSQQELFSIFFRKITADQGGGTIRQSE